MSDPDTVDYAALRDQVAEELAVLEATFDHAKAATNLNDATFSKETRAQIAAFERVIHRYRAFYREAHERAQLVKS